MRTFTNKSEGMEQVMKTMKIRQDSTKRLLKEFDQKYEGMMIMMAQLMAKVSDKGNELEGSNSSGGEAQQNESKLELQKEVSRKREPKILNKLPKMELPIFDGGNPREWIRKANEYFKIHGIEEDMKAEIAELYFRDKVDIWFHRGFQ